MTDMENQLTVIDGNDVFTIEEQDTLNQEIDRIISAHKTIDRKLTAWSSNVRLH